jgi:hypothetical protein
MSVRILAAALCVLFLGVPRVHAQSTDSSFTVGGIGGFGQTWDDESQIGTGLLLGVRADVRLVGGLRLDGALDWLRHNRDEGVFRSKGDTTFLTAALKYQFGGESGSGYVLGGPTLGFHWGTTTFEDISRDISSTSAGLAFGGGYSGIVGPGVEIGPEVRMVLLSSDDGSDPATAIYGGLRIAWRR